MYALELKNPRVQIHCSVQAGQLVNSHFIQCHTPAIVNVSTNASANEETENTTVKNEYVKSTKHSVTTTPPPQGAVPMSEGW